MSIFTKEKKIVIIGDRDGIPSEAISFTNSFYK